MIVLGIETSCDETAAAVVKDGNELLSNCVFSSMDLHAVYGGVVPEIAARSHIESILPVIEQALEQAFGTEKTMDSRQKMQNEALRPKNTSYWDKIDAIAVTYGAGLSGSLLVGVMTARALAITKKKPLYAINHVEGHVYANFLTNTSLEDYYLPKSQPSFPLLALIVSGGHSQLVLFRDHFDYTLLGQTRDDAIGEAFDKVAKITGLPYPGGPSIAQAALKGDPMKYSLPKSRLTGNNPALDELRTQTQNLIPQTSYNYDFSFSGLKTAVLRLAQEEIGENYAFPSYHLPERLSEAQKHDIAASFQRVAVETVADKTLLAYAEFQPESVVIAGGVAANQELRRQLAERLPCPINYTDIKLCTDNGAMIATLGCFKAMLGQTPVDPYTLQIQPNLSM